jgi:HK97 family phage prohead protease
MNTDKRTVYSADAKLSIEKTPVADATEPKLTLQGYAIVWNVLSTDRGGYKVRLKPGSATFTDPCLALYHHEFRDLLGNTANGTLRVMPDDVGVKVEIDLPDTTTAADVAELVEDGYLRGMSFSMAKGFEEFEDVEEGGEVIRDVTRFTCDEITVTVIPAFVQTTVAVKDPAEFEDNDKPEDDDDEEFSQSEKERAALTAKLREHRLFMHGQSIRAGRQET